MRELNPEKQVADLHSIEELASASSRLATGHDNSERYVKAALWYCGGMVRERRRELKMTQQDLALRVGMRTVMISRVEKGEADIVLSAFLRIMNVLDLRIDPHY